MLKRARLWALPVCLVYGLASGCASTHADPELMTLQPAELDGIKRNPGLKKLVIVDHVAGGAVPEPSWHVADIYDDDFTLALSATIEALGYLSTPEHARYELSAYLKNIEQPATGMDVTVNATIRYRLTDLKTQVALYDEVIEAAYTTTFSEGYVGQTRMRRTQEGAARKNIAKLLGKLGALNLKAAAAHAPAPAPAAPTAAPAP